MATSAVPTELKNGRMGGGVGSGQYRGAVVRQLLENQNTKGHWCPVDGCCEVEVELEEPCSPLYLTTLHGTVHTASLLTSTATAWMANLAQSEINDSMISCP